MTRTFDEMKALCLELARPLGESVAEHDDLGAVLIVYEPSAVDSDEDTTVAYAGTKGEDIPKVLIAVLKLYGYAILNFNAGKN
jgi:hypothetical protein